MVDEPRGRDPTENQLVPCNAGVAVPSLSGRDPVNANPVDYSLGPSSVLFPVYQDTMIQADIDLLPRDNRFREPWRQRQWEQCIDHLLWWAWWFAGQGVVDDDAEGDSQNDEVGGDAPKVVMLVLPIDQAFLGRKLGRSQYLPGQRSHSWTTMNVINASSDPDTETWMIWLLHDKSGY